MLKKLFFPILLFAAGVNVANSQVTNPNQSSSLRRGYELYEAGSYGAASTELWKVRENAAGLTGGEIETVDYMLAECAVKLGEKNAIRLLKAFTGNYPNSIYANDIRFATANSYYADGDYGRAIGEYLKTDASALPSSSRDEYMFKLGHSYFLTGDNGNARIRLYQVGEGRYKPHANYHISYIDYTNGSYGSAKKGFRDLLADPSYGRIIPFYLLQIEFLEGNYDYVVREGDALLSSAQGERAAEISRIMAESWFHKKDYESALRYMNLYVRNGGEMGRPEHYITGYSLFMRNDVSGAIKEFTLVAGPDDKLTQNAAYHLGGCYLRAGNKNEAMRALSMASSADYDPAIKEDALFNYGKLQFELGEGVFNEAINILTRYIKEYPSSPRVTQAREYLVSAYYNSRNYEAAYEAIKLIPNPDNNIRTAFQKITYFRALDCYGRGEFDRAYTIFDESLKNKFNPKYTALAQFWKGEILYRKGNFAAAIPLYREYISLSPSSENEHKAALYNLGYCCFNLSRWSESRTWFDRFLKEYTAKDVFRADTYNRIGDIHYAQREFWKAAENYDSAIATGTDERYYSQYQRAIVLGFVDRSQRKLESLNDIVAAGKGPYVGDAMYSLGREYIAQERFRDAVSTLKRFTDAYPSSDKYAAALSDLGLAYQNLGDDKTALTYYKMVIDKVPNSQEAKSAMLAVKSLYMDMNDVDGYFAFASESGMETDVSVVARDSLTYAAAERLYLSSASRSSAAAALRDYLDKFPRGVYRPDALYYAADASLASGGKESDAVKFLRELSEMHYNSFTIRGLEKLAPLLYGQGRFEEAAGIYSKLANTAVNPQTVASAYSGYLASVRQTGDKALQSAAAEEVIASAKASAETKREARFLKAGILESSGKRNEADVLYGELSTESSTRIGAESTLKVIESLYAAGKLGEAEKRIMEFADRNTPHTYFLGKAFLILGDIYADKGDKFQARATLQSIVDGYSPADDGILEATKKRINSL